MVGTYFLQAHQRCKTQPFRPAMWNLLCCERSERLLNFYFCWPIMSQFKVEKGMSCALTGEPFLIHIELIASFLLDESGLLWLKFKWNSPAHFVYGFFCFPVTKVKALTDLSDKAKVGEKLETTAKRSRGSSATGTERPTSSSGRQTSVKVG